MKKILIIGNSGSGKTTFAHRLSLKTSLPIIHLDQYFWKPEWRQTPKEEWERIVSELVNKTEWIMDGNYGSSFNLRFPVADTIILLEVGPIKAIFRAAKRSILNWGKTRKDMADGCEERFDLNFYRYIWSFNKIHRPRIENSLKLYAGKAKIYRLKNSKQIEKFISELK